MFINGKFFDMNTLVNFCQAFKKTLLLKLLSLTYTVIYLLKRGQFCFIIPIIALKSTGLI